MIFVSAGHFDLEAAEAESQAEALAEFERRKRVRFLYCFCIEYQEIDWIRMGKYDE